MRTLHYVADPMCSWCWGFAPILARIEARIPVRYVMGGLAPDDDAPMDLATRRHVQGAWDAVERATGATFERRFWEVCSPRRSTWPACRAVLAAEALAGAGRAMFARIQRAYYAEARDPSRRAELIALGAELGLDLGPLLDSEATRAALAADLSLRDRLGVRSFPSLALVEEGRATRLMTGWEPPEPLLARLEAHGLHLSAE